jgi:hypothetical protein
MLLLGWMDEETDKVGSIEFKSPGDVTAVHPQDPMPDSL